MTFFVQAVFLIHYYITCIYFMFRKSDQSSGARSTWWGSIYCWHTDIVASVPPRNT